MSMTDPSLHDDAAFGITWGVKSSFLGYIHGLSDGSIGLGDGATMSPEGLIHFPFAGLHAVENEAERWIRCTGSVLFQGHFGMLTVPLRRLSLQVVPDGATLFSEQEDGSVYPLGTVALSEPDITAVRTEWAAAPVTLSESGSVYFGSMYPVGTAMDPLLIRLPPQV